VTEDESLGGLVEELRRIERRREGATPGSSEYIELVGFERALIDEIRALVIQLDTPPGWHRDDEPAPRNLPQP
jgi:hypothetical protein